MFLITSTTGQTVTAYLHGFTESVGEVQLPVFEALDCEEKTDRELMNFLMSSPTVLLL